MEDLEHCQAELKGEIICKATGGMCDRIKCYEKIHYVIPTKQMQDKLDYWAAHRRGEKRWENKEDRE